MVHARVRAKTRVYAQISGRSINLCVYECCCCYHPDHCLSPAPRTQVMALKFKAGVKRVDRVNARVAYINDDMTPPERALWLEQFDGVDCTPFLQIDALCASPHRRRVVRSYVARIPGYTFARALSRMQARGPAYTRFPTFACLLSVLTESDRNFIFTARAHARHSVFPFPMIDAHYNHAPNIIRPLRCSPRRRRRLGARS